MGGGKRGQEYTVGYRYYASIHMALCHGPVDAIVRMIVGDKTVWSGNLSNGALDINLPGLFGGEDGEGGIAGHLEVLSGSSGQGQNAFLAGILGSDCPAYRGVVSVVLENFMICSMNPYPKPWRFVVRRFPAVIPSANSVIAGAFANPAQIIAECLLNQEWGLGVEGGEIDYDSFRAVAGTLQTEGFGLCPRWDQTSSLEDFIGEICNIIDGQLQMDPTSGRYSLKLIRQDYDPASLATLDASSIIRLTDFSRPDPKELINEVVIVFEDYSTGVQQSVTEKNTAALALNPAINSTQLNYQAVPTQALARRIALRELAQYSSGLARCSLEANRTAAGLMMGDCFVLTWPPLGIDSMIMRVTHVSQGSSTDWRVRLDCVQDIYGMPSTAFSEIQSGWSPPDYTPRPMSGRVVYELPYYFVSLFITGDNDSSWSDQPPGFGYVAVVAQQPSGMTSGFKVNLRDSANQWQPDRSLAFTDYGIVSEDFDDVQTQIKISEGIMQDVEPNEPVLVDSEFMQVYSYDRTNRILTVGRGCLDTVPAPHAAGAVVWFTGNYNNAVTQVFVTSQTASMLLQPFSPSGLLPQGQSTGVSFVLANRAGRPVAPANVRVNGTYRPKTLAAWANTLTWSRRDRQNTVRPIPNTEGDYLPEDGTTCRAEIAEKIFPDSAWTAASVSEGLDGVSLPLTGIYTPQAYALRFSLSSRLGTLASFQINVVETVHSPWVPEAVSRTVTAPPGGQARGACYVIPASGSTGAWAGRGNQIAVYYSSWRYHAPAQGQRVLAAGVLIEFDGTAWEEVVDA
ncbi:MAG: DUF2793 domain-containing protein [Deltaproteobacteria bacterium]|jgi:hypothetical protein|nr:DUF2793 domain-containing protein [Deltaproteobacteria bacterium]